MGWLVATITATTACTKEWVTNTGERSAIARSEFSQRFG